MPQAATARRSRSQEKPGDVEHVHEKGKDNVIESSGEEESIRNQMRMLNEAVGQLTTLVTEQAEDHEKHRNDVDDRFERMSRSLVDLHNTIERVDERVSKVQSTPVRDRVKRAEEFTGNFITKNAKRAWSGTKRVMVPRKPTDDTIQGAIYANLVEYFALVAMAQVAPMATLNTISGALFIS